MIKIISIDEAEKCGIKRCRKEALYFITDLHPERFGMKKGERTEQYFCTRHFVAFCRMMLAGVEEYEREKHGKQHN